MKVRLVLSCSALAGAVALVGLLWAEGAANAQGQGVANRVPGRFIPVTPASGGDNSYPNFLWIVDSATGDVVAHRIASVKSESGEHAAWVTERLMSVGEYLKFNEVEGANN